MKFKWCFVTRRLRDFPQRANNGSFLWYCDEISRRFVFAVCCDHLKRGGCPMNCSGLWTPRIVQLHNCFSTFLTNFRMLPKGWVLVANNLLRRNCSLLLSETASASGSVQTEAQLSSGGKQSSIRFEAGHVARLADGAAVTSQGNTAVCLHSLKNRIFFAAATQ